MNDTEERGRFLSDCIDVFIDEPGDHAVRPIAPGPRLEQARALRDQILAAEAAEKQRAQGTPQALPK